MGQLLLFICILVTVMLGVTSVNTPITCTAGEFMKFMSGSVTCKFNENIKQSRKNFNIVQYPFNKGNSNSDSGTYVLVCNWGAGDSLDCKTEAGFSFNKQVSDRITLEIPDVTSSVGGVYVCQVVPDSGIPLETCTLKVKDFALPTPTSNCSCPNVDCGPEDTVIVVLILIVIMLIIMVIFVIIFTRRRFRCVRQAGDPTKDHCICCGLTSRIQRKRHIVRNIYRDTKEIQTESENPLLTNKPYTVPIQEKATAGSVLYNTDGAKVDLSNNLYAYETGDVRADGSRKPQRENPNDVKSGDSANLKQAYDAQKTQPPQKENPIQGYSHDMSASKDAKSAPRPIELDILNYDKWTNDEVVEWLRQNNVQDAVLEVVKKSKKTGSLLKEKTRKQLGDLGLKGKQLTEVHALVVGLRESSKESSKKLSKK